MPDIVNPLYVSFANTRLRPCGDAAETLYQTCKRFQQEWLADSCASIPNTVDFIADGAQPSASNGGDGRKAVTGTMCQNFNSLVTTMVTWFETAVTVGGVTLTRIQWIQQLTVNGAARF